MKLNESNGFYRLVRSEAWDIGFARYCFGSDGSDDKYTIKIKKWIREKGFTVKDSGATHRVINHWTDRGLINDNARKSDQEWRKFSVVDLVWIHILMELRRFGMPLEAMKKAYQSTFFSPAKNQVEIPILEFSIFRCMIRKPIVVIVYADGWCEYLTKSDYEFNLQIGLLEEKAYLVVNLNQCVRSVLPKIDAPEYPLTVTPTEAELEVIGKLRKGEFDELNIQLKNGEIHSLKTIYKSNEDVLGLIEKLEYGECKIVRQKGKTVLTQVSELQRIES